MSRVAEELWASALKDARASIGRCKNVDFSDLDAWSTSKEIREFATQLGHRQHECFGWKKSKWAILVKTIHHHASAFDVFVQQQPVIACLVWGTCRLVIQIAAREVQFDDRVAEALTVFVKNLDRYQIEACLFAASQRVRSAIQELFFQTISLILYYRAHLSQSRLKRFLRAGVVPGISDAINTLKGAANHLDRELTTAGLQAQKGESEQQARYRKDSSATLQDIRSIAVRIDDKVVRCTPQITAHNVQNWLRPGVFDPGEVADPEPGTCEGLMTGPVWRNWSSSEFAGTLFLVGDSGSGKSVYARFLASKLSSGDRPVVSHFFKETIGHEYADAKYLAVSILSQLWSTVIASIDEAQSAQLVEKFQPVLNTYPDIRDCTFNTLVRLAKQFLRHVHQVTLIVDALDECSTSATEIGDFLVELGRCPGTQVIVTTRNILPLAQPQGQVAQLWIRLTLDESVVQPDIKLFVERAIGRQPKLRSLQREVLERVTKQAGGNFLAAQLFIAGLQSARSPKHLRVQLCSLSKMFPEQYQQLLVQSNARLLPEDRTRRDDIFRLLVSTRSLLKAIMISQLLALDLNTGLLDDEDIDYDPDHEIIRLCQPFVRISTEHAVEFIHGSAKVFLQTAYTEMIEISDADLFLARKCLALLNEARYADPKTSADLLRRHFLKEGKEKEEESVKSPHSDLYIYAALYFQDHVTAVLNPPDDLIQSLKTFLLGPQFVAWSEAILDLRSQLGLAVHITVCNDLRKWTAGLPEGARRGVPIEDFFEAPHHAVSTLFKKGEFEPALQYLPLLRIGDYFNEGGQSVSEWQKAFENKKSAVAGLSKIFGSDNRLVLKFTAEVIREYFWQKRFREALSESLSLAELQRKVVGESEPDLYFTLWLVGAAYLSLSCFEEMKDVYAEALAGLERLVGSSANLYLYIQFYEGNGLERNKQNEQALELYEGIIKILQPIVGERYPFLTMVQTAAGSVLRKKKDYAKAEGYLIPALGGRNKIYSLGVNVLVDTALQLALLYRDMGDRKQCLKTLKAAETSSVYDNDFERLCQMKHIRALSDFDNGEYDEPKSTLFDLIDKSTGSNRDKNNRELLWVRLTLATVMRARGEADDALMLFSELVEPDGEGLKDEPEPPAQLRVAEEALVFVRQAKLTKAKDLLQSNGLRWVKEKDFDILAQGGPVVDTAEIAPIKLH